MTFFGHIHSLITTRDAEAHNQATNFSGEYSFSNPTFAEFTAQYLWEKIPKLESHIDLGASRGTLSSILLKYGVDSYSVDGTDYGLRKNLLDISPERYAVIDLTKPLPDNHPTFQLSTAFEVTEHIPKDLISAFYDNVRKFAKLHICSVHFGGEEQGSHYNIRPTKWWIEFLSKYGKVNKLDDMRMLYPFEESEFLMVDFE